MTLSLNLPDSDLEGSVRTDDLSRGSVYHTLLYTVLQKPRELDGSGVVIALSSSNRREGVTSVARQIVQELGRGDFTSAACINVNFLRRLHEPTIEAIRSTLMNAGSRFATDGKPEGSLIVQGRRGPWEGSWQYRRECIQLLRSEFEYTIIDCPSLEQSGDVLSIAPFVDGVILVVESNRTRRDQPRQAEQNIAAAGGKVLGYILNKRKYEIPQWLYRRL